MTRLLELLISCVIVAVLYVVLVMAMGGLGALSNSGY